MATSPFVQHTLLDVDLINNVLTANAMSIVWFPARRCSCWSNLNSNMLATGSPDSSCATCKGLGRVYPTEYILTGVVLDDMQDIAIWSEQSGITYGGVIRMHVPYTIGNLYTQGALNDLILPQDIVLTTKQMVIKGVDALDETPVTPLTLTSGATTYTQNVDFTIYQRQLTWLTTGPPTNSRYEAVYGFQPWFSIVKGLAIANNEAHLNLPRTYVLQLTPSIGELYPYV